ncbi:hypothetical protein FIU87_18975 [Bacillus sp. THAF10]|uniref:hypothetical protein n=1 Tax=Bacillus sp. THAF10 TaxID=2587848 RepID=UPI0012A7FC73|nr:hypothetical protein [Bacillus sp. THAF10]QFT90731.1 hypothetical protein FIU87_18975 [Bacillus sp. THAF10]
MKMVNHFLFFWHQWRANYFAAMAEGCLDKKLKMQLEEKSDMHKLEALQCKAKTQNITC